VTSKLDLLVGKIQQAVEQLQILRKENERLKGQCDTLKSQLAQTSGENRKAQQVIAEYDQLKQRHDEATARVERALQKLSVMRVQ
jgi:FtsZ-binding cell division protein ZapB